LERIEGAAGDPAAQTAQVSALQRRLRADFRAKFQFRPYSAATSQQDSVIEVSLVAGMFAGAESVLTQFIESAWTSAGLRIQLSWIAADAMPGTFTFKVGEGFGSRAYVDFNEASVVLYPSVRSQTIAHEFGHVIGFRDHYHTIWNPGRCVYADQHNEEDLMSVSRTGSVTTEEWTELRDVYVGPALED